MYRLKAGEPAIDVVDGPFAGKGYRHGQVYAEVPPEEARRFEAVEEDANLGPGPRRLKVYKSGPRAEGGDES